MPAPIDRATQVKALSIKNQVGIFSESYNPSITGHEAPIGSMLLQSGAGKMWMKIGPLDTDWEEGGTGGGGGGPTYSITSFTVTPNEAENGDTVTSVQFNWTLPSDGSSQSINNGIGTIAPVTLRTHTESVSLTTDTTYTLTVIDNLTPYNANATVDFKYRIYWGVSTDNNVGGVDTASAGVPQSGGTPIAINASDLVTAGITNSVLANNKNQTRNFNATGGRFLYFLWPTAYGVPTFTVNGFPSTGWKGIDTTFTNTFLVPTTYTVWRTQFIQNGSSINVVVS